jgi:hypothetical protein
VRWAGPVFYRPSPFLSSPTGSGLASLDAVQAGQTTEGRRRRGVIEGVRCHLIVCRSAVCWPGSELSGEVLSSILRSRSGTE